LQYVICIVFFGRDYHYQAGVKLENFTEVKFRDILLNRDGTPGQTFKPGQSRPNRDVW